MDESADRHEKPGYSAVAQISVCDDEGWRTVYRVASFDASDGAGWLLRQIAWAAFLGECQEMAVWDEARQCFRYPAREAAGLLAQEPVEYKLANRLRLISLRLEEIRGDPAFGPAPLGEPITELDELVRDLGGASCPKSEEEGGEPILYEGRFGSDIPADTRFAIEMHGFLNGFPRIYVETESGWRRVPVLDP